MSRVSSECRRRSLLGSLASFLLLGLACRKAVQEPAEITLVLIDQTWLDRSFQDRRNLELEQFSKETGIRVKLLPAPEGAVETLDACFFRRELWNLKGNTGLAVRREINLVRTLVIDADAHHIEIHYRTQLACEKPEELLRRAD